MAVLIYLINQMVERYRNPHKCSADEECDNPVTHYDSQSNGFCDYHWQNWD